MHRLPSTLSQHAAQMPGMLLSSSSPSSSTSKIQRLAQFSAAATSDQTRTAPTSLFLAHHHQQHAQTHVQRAFYSSGKRPGFFENIIKNLKEEYSKNQEMQETLKKFREDAKKLEESEALKEARRKFQSIEGESAKSGKAFKEHFSGIADKVKGTLEEASKAEALKRAGQISQEFSQKFGSAAESFRKTDAFKTATNSAETLRKEIEGDSLGAKVYRPPTKLRKRKETVRREGEESPIEANEDATGVELHKDSKFYQSWQNFKDNNPFVNKFVDYRMKYEESDNPMVRGARLVTDKLSEIFGGMFTRTEISEVLTEIVKMDPNFCKETFLRDCERDFIPNILEAMVRGDLEILEDWCYEATFNILATPIRQAKQMGYVFDSKIIDIDNIDIAMGKMMEQGPVLVITFSAQQINCIRDSKGNVVEGDPNQVLRMSYVWVMCRDQTELDPKAAWRLLEMAATSTEQFI